METETKSRSDKRWIIILVLIIAVAAVAITLILVNRGPAETANVEDDGTPKLVYAEGVTAIDEDSLQKAVDEMLEKVEEGRFALSYKNDAFSDDGTNFSCYIANSEQNSYDMFIAIYADSELTDQIFLSGLVRPGNAFEEISLSHALEPGTHRVYVAYTQVEEDLETIHAQVVVTMDFTVTQ